MIIGIALHYLKMMLVGVVCSSIVYYPYQIITACGIALDGASIADLTGAFEEMLNGLPIIGGIIESLFSFEGAIFTTATIEKSIYSEVLYSLLLFAAYEIMARLRTLIDEVFSGIEGEQNIFSFIASGISTMFVIGCSVMAANLFDQTLRYLVPGQGSTESMAILCLIIIGAVALACIIGKQKGVLSAVIDMAYKLISGLVICCLIYMTVLLGKMSTLLEYATWGQSCAIIGGLIACILVLTILGAKSFAEAFDSL